MDSEAQIQNNITENHQLFIGEIWKPAIRNGKILPGYEVSSFGRIKNKKGKFMILKNEVYEEKGNRQSLSLCIPDDLFDDYQYQKANPGNSKRCKIRVSVHRIVMETFKPIEEHPPHPMTKEDWSSTPDSAKKILKDSCCVDHINDNPFDNRIENLRWVSSKDNSNFRKKAFFDKKEEVC